ncbi:ABC transporter permease [Planktomarina temperata]|nr:ABC transporter permease [Planktomarina temperata]
MLLYNEFSLFLIHIWKNRPLLRALIKNDFKKQYLGSYLGLSWALIQPLMFVAIIWIVFELGFRKGPTVTGVPFVLWLFAGMVPWFFFSDALRSGADAIVGNAFLVKKVAFRVSILPLVNIGSCFLIHLGLVIFLTLALLLNGYLPSMYWIQLPYYIALTILFATGCSWLTSAIRVFVKDMGSIIRILLQMIFWLTPIFWSIELIPEKYHYLIKLNPLFYLIEGYRDTFISQVWFWEKPTWSFYYLAITAVFLVLGALVFKRLRPHFADVL